MPVADDLYLLYHKTNDIATKLIEEWEDNFEWLQEVLIAAKEAKGKTVIPKTPAAGRGKRKRKPSSVEGQKFVHPSEIFPAPPKPKRKKAGTRSHVTKTDDQCLSNEAKLDDGNTRTNEVSQDTPMPTEYQTEQACTTATRQSTRAKKKTNQTDLSATDNSELDGKAIDSTEVMPSQNTVSLTEKPPKDITTQEEPIHTPDEDDLVLVNEPSLQPKITRPSSQKIPLSHDIEASNDEDLLPEQEEILVEQTPNQRRLRSTVQKTPKTPAIPHIDSPNKITLCSLKVQTPQKENVATNNITPVRKKVSSYTSSHTPVKSPIRDNSEFSSPKRKAYGTLKHTTKKAKVQISPLSQSVIRSSVNQSSRMNRVQKGPGTPTTAGRLKNMPPKLISSGSLYRSRPMLQSASPLVRNKLVRATSDLGKSSNILTGITSLVSRVIPKQPTKEEIEKEKQAARELKRKKQEESQKKKDELLKLKADEQKRKNEIRMKRVQEARMLQEREKKIKEDERIKLEKERKLRDEEKAREDKERKRRQLAKAEEEALKITRMKAQQEEEERLRREQVKREKDQERLQEMKLKMEAQKKALEQKRETERVAREQYQLMKTLTAQRIEKQKIEMEKIKAHEAQRPSPHGKETPQVLDSTYTKSPVQSYDMTPAPAPKLQDPNNYGIEDRRSDDSTDEEDDPRKEIPAWAQGTSLKSALFNQEFYSGEVENIFPPSFLLQPPDLDNIFFKKRSRFFKRTSSAIWNTPPEQLG